MPVSDATYERVALEDDTGRWELVCGHLQQKPSMTADHQQTARNLVLELALQLPRAEFSVGQEGPNLRIPGGNYRIPDVCVIPRHLVQRRRREHPSALESYDEPMPLVVEVWSPSTGTYDVEEKLREYQRRGDLEIWRLHPIERTLTAWRRQPDGSYTEILHRGGIVHLTSLPGVTLNLNTLFD